MGAAYDEIERRPWTSVEALHAERLPDQLDYVAETSDFYQRRFDEWGIDPAAVPDAEAFAQLPFTTKADERRSQAEATA